MTKDEAWKHLTEGDRSQQGELAGVGAACIVGYFLSGGPNWQVLVGAAVAGVIAYVAWARASALIPTRKIAALRSREANLVWGYKHTINNMPMLMVGTDDGALTPLTLACDAQELFRAIAPPQATFGYTPELAAAFAKSPKSLLGAEAPAAPTTHTSSPLPAQIIPAIHMALWKELLPSVGSALFVAALCFGGAWAFRNDPAAASPAAPLVPIVGLLIVAWAVRALVRGPKKMPVMRALLGEQAMDGFSAAHIEGYRPTNEMKFTLHNGNARIGEMTLKREAGEPLAAWLAAQGHSAR